MTDVARLAGVSQSCVSLVLNDSPGGRLSDATRLRVRQVATELGYKQPARTANRAMAVPARSVIAYVVDEVSVSPHPVLQIDGARDAAWSHRATVQVHVTRGSAELEAASIHAIRQDPSIAGVIYASSFTREVAVPPALAAMPLVLLNCYTSPRLHPVLLPAEVAGGFAATLHLLSQGHRRIGMIGGEAWMDAARDRLRGYREALATADIGFDPALVGEGDWSAGSGYLNMLKLMQQGKPPTAVFCANDMMALGSMDALIGLGLSVPGDVSVIGYNDIELARHTRPALSSCRVPNYELGQRAVELLVGHATEGKPLKATLTKLECQVVVRASTAGPAIRRRQRRSA